MKEEMTEEEKLAKAIQTISDRYRRLLEDVRRLSGLAKQPLEIPVQVNGKKRGVVRVPPGATEDDVFSKAATDPSISKYWDGKELARKIWVQDRILTLVVKSQSD